MAVEARATPAVAASLSLDRSVADTPRAYQAQATRAVWARCPGRVAVVHNGPVLPRVIGPLGLALLVVGCGREERAPQKLAAGSDDPAAPAVPVTEIPEMLAGLESIDIEQPQAHWSEQQGFVVMQPPVNLPTSSFGRSKVEVHLALPEDGVIEVRDDGPDGGPNLHLPAGTVADRLEYVSLGKGDETQWLLADVRGGSITEDGQRFHVLRPAKAGPGAAMFGYEWTRGADELAARAHERIAFAMRNDGAGFAKARKSPNQSADHFVGLARCDGCHLRNKPTYKTRADVKAADAWRPNRASDASGYYSVLTTLHDEMVLEGGRPWDTNPDDPLVSVSCPDGEAKLISNDEKGTRHYVCEDGSLPVGRRDVAKGLASGDLTTARLCAARRYLWEHMDGAGREVFAPAFESCRIGVEP